MHSNNHKSNTVNSTQSVQKKATTWAQVYDNYAPMMYGIILKMTDDKTIACDILSEAFVELNAKNTIVKINSLICLRCAYKITLKYAKDRGLKLSNTRPFNQKCLYIYLFYVKAMSLEKILIDLKVTKDEALKNLRAEIKYLRGQSQ